MGLAGALATVIFRELLGWIQMLLGGVDSPHGMVSLARGMSSWERLLLPAAGGAIAGLILQVAARRLPPRGAADYMEAIAIGRGVIGFRQTVARSISSLADGAVGGDVLVVVGPLPGAAAAASAAAGGVRRHRRDHGRL
ncbi:hypothetical protein CNMCM8686_007961 [Aspergillus fumigatus]|nr:hypothetical protein CNMCM8686_007961 [Aspergillus fumigatus]